MSAKKGATKASPKQVPKVAVSAKVAPVTTSVAKSEAKETKQAVKKVSSPVAVAAVASAKVAAKPKAEKKERKVGKSRSKRATKVALPTKDALLTTIDTLSYHDRVQLAAQIGADNRESKQVDALIKDLTTHVAPAAITIPAEAGFEALFPAQTNNIKFFHEDRLGLQIAASSRRKDVLSSTFNNTSVFFKKFVSSQIASSRTDRKSNSNDGTGFLFTDDDISRHILAAEGNAAKRKLIAACMRFGRQGVLEKILVPLTEQLGTAGVYRFIHGCSAATVTKYLSQPDFLTSKVVRWHKLVSVYPMEVLAVIKSELAAANPGDKNATHWIWRTWFERLSHGSADEVLVRRPEASTELLRLALTYAPARLTHSFKSFLAYKLDASLPLAAELAIIERRFRVENLSVELPRLITRNGVHWHKHFGATLTAYHMITMAWNNSVYRTSKQIAADESAARLAKKAANKDKKEDDSSETKESKSANKPDDLDTDYAVPTFNNDAHSVQSQPLLFTYFAKTKRALSRDFDRKGIASFLIAIVKEVPFVPLQRAGSLMSILRFCELLPRYELRISAALLEWIDRTAPTSDPSKARGIDEHREWRDAARYLWQLRHTAVLNRFKSVTAKMDACSWNLHLGYMHASYTLLQQKVTKSESTLRSFNDVLTQVHQHRVGSINRVWRHPDDNADVWGNEVIRLLSSETSDISSANQIGTPIGIDLPSFEMIPYRSLVRPLIASGSVLLAAPVVTDDGLGRSSRVRAAAATPVEVRRSGGSDYIRYIGQLLQLLFTRRTTTTSSTVRDAADADAKEVFNDAWRVMTPYRLSYLSSIIRSWLPYVAPSNYVTLIKSLTDDDLLHLGQNEADMFLKLVDLVSRESVEALQSIIKPLLAPDQLAIETKDKLLAYQQIDTGVWKALVKATDSNSPAQRSAAYRTMITATMRGRSPQQLVKTLQVLVKKIKNESIHNRADVIDQLLSQMNIDDVPTSTVYANQATARNIAKSDSAFLLSPETLKYWLEMLQDALEVQDLDELVPTFENHWLRTWSFSAGYWRPDIIVILPPADTTRTLRRPADRPIFADNRDAYEKQTKSHYLLNYFHRLAIAAIRLGADDTTRGLFDFGVELQWRMAVFRLGDKYAALHFRIDPGTSLPNYHIEPKERASYKPVGYAKQPDLTAGREAQFVTGWLRAYTDRIADRNPTWFSEPISACSYLEAAFRIAGKACFAITELASHLRIMIDTIKTASKDHDGLYIINADHGAIKIFEFLLQLQGRTWATVPILVEYVELVMRTRQAPRVFWKWYQLHCPPTTLIEDKRVARSALVNTLLTITPSAIHLPFVWRYLMRYEQHKLDRFINAQSRFRGVFYRAPDQRTVGVPPSKQRGEGRIKDGRFTPARWRCQPYTSAMNKRVQWWKVFMVDDAQKAVKEELEAEANLIEERDQLGRRDFVENFRITATHGLYRLLARQSAAIGIEHARAGLNPDRGMPDRAKALIQWSLLPTTSYTDVAYFSQNALVYDPETCGIDADKLKKVEDNKKKAEARRAIEAAAAAEAKAAAAAASGGEEVKEAKKPGSKKKAKKDDDEFPVLLAEALIRGCMQNDDRLAPLRYLLQPSFLSSQVARVAIYAISACIPYVSAPKLEQILDFILTKRRRALKVTAYKEVLRRVAGDGSAKNQAGILKEWERDEVHRDVRIVIIGLAIRFLALPNDRGLTVAWKILDAAVRSDHTEILASLLGAKPAGDAEPRFEPEGLTQDSTIAEHVVNMSSISVPQSQCTRYATSILHKLASAGDDISEDVRALAIAALVDWIPYCDTTTQQLIAELWVGVICCTDVKNLADPRAKTQTVNDARWKNAASSLLYVCDLAADQVGGKGAIIGVDVAARVTKTLSNLAMTTVSRPLRLALFNRLDKWLRLPRSHIGADHAVYAPELLNRDGQLFYRLFLSRRFASLYHDSNHQTIDATVYGDKLLRTILAALRECSTINVTDCDFFISRASQALKKGAISNNIPVIHQLLHLLHASVTGAIDVSDTKRPSTNAAAIFFNVKAGAATTAAAAAAPAKAAAKGSKGKAAAESKTATTTPASASLSLTTTQVNMLTTLVLNALRVSHSVLEDVEPQVLWFVEHLLRSASIAAWTGQTITTEGDEQSWVNTWDGSQLTVTGLDKREPFAAAMDAYDIVVASCKRETLYLFSLSPLTQQLITFLLQSSVAAVAAGAREQSERAFKGLAGQTLLNFGRTYPGLLVQGIQTNPLNNIATLFREWLRFVASTPLEQQSNASERRVRTIDTVLRVLHHIHQHETNPASVGLGGYTAISDDATMLNKLMGGAPVAIAVKKPVAAKKGAIAVVQHRRRYAGDASDSSHYFGKNDDAREGALADSARVTDNVGERMLRPLIERILTDKLVEETMTNKTYQLLSAVSFDLAINVLCKFPRFIVQAPEIANGLIMEAVGRAVLLPAVAADVRTRLKIAIITAFQDDIKYPEEDTNQASRVLTKKVQWKVLKQVLDPLMNQSSLTTKRPSLFSAVSLKNDTDSEGLAGWQELIRSRGYHHIAGLIAIDIISYFGDATKVAAIDEAKAKKATPAAAKKQAESKETKKEEKKSSPTRTIWRSEFDELLNVFANDNDAALHRLSYYLPTSEPIKKAKATGGATDDIKVLIIQRLSSGRNPNYLS